MTIAASNRLSGRPLARAGCVLRRLAVLAVVPLLAACNAQLPILDGRVGAGVGAGQTVQVAMLLPYGSPNSGDDAIARSLENAARLAVAEGADAQITVYNTAADPGTAARLASQAVADGAQVILGPLRSDAAAAAGLAVAGASVPVLSFSNNTDIAGGNVLILGNSFRNTADRIIGYAAAQGRNRLLVVHSENLQGRIAAEAAQEAAARGAAQIAGVISYEFSQNGVVQAIPGVMSELRGSGANGLVLPADSAGALPFFAQLLPENGLDPEVTQLIGMTRWDIPAQTLELSGLDGGWFTVPDPGATAAFNARYEGAYGAGPHPLGGLGYDGVRAITEAAGRGGVAIADLTASGGIDGANGVFRLLTDGTAQRALAVAQVTNQSVSIIDPAPRRLGGAGL